MKKNVFSGIFLVFSMAWMVLGSPAQARAEEDMWTKLGRGLANIGTGWMELGYQPSKMAEEKRWPTAVLGGIPKGIFYTYMRTMVGVYETVTFFIPAPEGYKPIMEPEFIVPE